MNRKARSVVFAITVGISFSSLVHAQEQLADLVERIRPSVVAVTTYDKFGRKLAGGSGFAVAPNKIITNKHVIESSFRTNITTSEGKLIQVDETLAVDEDGDLALLKVDALPSSVRPMTISKVPPRPGDRIFVIGNPLGLEGSVSDGIVSAFRDVRGIGRLVQITAAISHGSSGSPVINSWGDVIGIATLYLEGGQNLNFAISSERIVNLWSDQLKVSEIERKTSTAPEQKQQVVTPEERRPQTALEWFDRGLTEIDNEKYEIALDCFKQAVRLNPNFAFAHHGIATALYNLGRYKEALAPMQEALRLVDGFDNQKKYVHDLGTIYNALGDRKAAFEQYNWLKGVDANLANHLLAHINDMSGYWKSSIGYSYQIIDKGDSVVVNYYSSDGGVAYEAKKKDDIAYGYVFHRFDDKYPFVFRLVDSNHIWFRRYHGLNFKEPADKVLKKAQEQSEKSPDEIWTRMNQN